MRYGVLIPNGGDYCDPRTLADMAREAEESGWDGFFIWDHLARGADGRYADPWIALAAIAMRTERVRIGPMVTPLPRRRPWKLARETVSLDHLSNGRLILGVGLGYPADDEFERFGEEGDDRVRARKLDEGLAVLTGLWSGEPFSYDGQHFQVRETVFLPRPVQTPRIPIWVAGTWPGARPLKRSLRWDGYFPERAAPDDIRAVLVRARERSGDDPPFDVAFGDRIPAAETARLTETVAAYADAGLTWWMQRLGPDYGSPEASRARIRLGPPRV